MIYFEASEAKNDAAFAKKKKIQKKKKKSSKEKEEKEENLPISIGLGEPGKGLYEENCFSTI